jgi:aryl-alcohol dehydrogenase-like predicted oxidoreductase
MIGRAPFGATGHDSSRVVFGAAALASVSKGAADRALDVLIEHGVNHIDVAASYGDAELRGRRATGCPLAQAPSGHVLPRHEDRGARLPRRA